MPPSQTLKIISGLCEEGAERIEQDVADAPAQHHAEHAVEDQVAESPFMSTPGRRPARMRWRPSHQAVAKASRYITPYQWIFSGPSGQRDRVDLVEVGHAGLGSGDEDLFCPSAGASVCMGAA